MNDALTNLLAAATTVTKNIVDSDVDKLEQALKAFQTDYRAPAIPFKVGVKQTEYVSFRLLVTPCCGAALCWVNPRFPNYCPECGKSIFPAIRGGVMLHDPDATLVVTPQQL